FTGLGHFDAELFQNVGAAALRGKRSIAVLSHTNARARNDKRRDRRDVKRRNGAATGAAGVKERLGMHTRLDADGFFTHRSRKAKQLVWSFALHMQGDQEGRDLWRGCYAAQNPEHGLIGFGRGEIVAARDSV